MMRSTTLAAAVLLSSSAALAGTADVRYVNPETFSDLATNRWEEADVMRALSNHLQRLAQGLPAGQVLHVDVIDVDLAGSWRQTSRGRIRTVTNRADPPKFHLRYTLESGGQALRSGDDFITDIDYTNHVFLNRTSTPLYYEKRLLDEWFVRTFQPQTQADAR